MNASKEYSAQELAVMSREELLTQLQRWKEEQLVQPALPAGEPSRPLVQPEVLRAIGGL